MYFYENIAINDATLELNTKGMGCGARLLVVDHEVVGLFSALTKLFSREPTFIKYNR